MRPRHGNGGAPRDRSLVTTDRLQGERGASLVLALCMVLVLAVTLSAVLAYTRVIYKTTPIYTKQRTERYAGDGAIETAINHVRNNLDQGMDPAYDNSITCAYNVPTAVGNVAVTCSGDAGSGAGVPVDGGKYPDQAILALGTNHEETGPLNYTGCTYLGAIVNRATIENSVTFKKGQVTTALEQGNINPFNACETRNRALDQFAVRGAVRAAGKLGGEGSLSLQNAINPATGATISPGRVSIGYGSCSSTGVSLSAQSPPACQKLPASDPTLQDPGNGGAVEEWNPVPINWNADHIRTGGFEWNGTTLSPSNGCSTGDVIVLLPGTYAQASYLNQYTADPNCKKVTLWLAPDPGADGQLLTDDDKTGAFYFGFAGGPSASCNGMPANNARWCIGASSDANIRVVGGMPEGWNPLAVPGSGTSGTFTMSQADTIDGQLSVKWYDNGNAASIDGQVAKYEPICLFGICSPSDDRLIILRNFSPSATGIPDGAVGSKVINIKVAHRETGSGLQNPQITIRTTGGVTCPDTYRVPANNGGSLRTDALELGLPTTGNPAGGATRQLNAAKSIANCLTTDDRINDLELSYKVYGNSTNSGVPRLYLDGFSVDFLSTPTASFPIPVAGSTDTSADPDCDKSKPGVQLVYAGGSNTYVADGTLEVCAGPYPNNPGRHQQVAIYGVKAIPPVLPQTITAGGDGTVFREGGSVDNAATASKDIAEPAGKRIQDISYSFPNAGSQSGCWFCFKSYEGVENMTMTPRPTPSGLQVDKVIARVTYDSNNTCLTIFGRDLCVGTNSQIRAGSCGGIDAPKTTNLRSWQTDVTSCFTQAQIENGASVAWAARGSEFCFTPRISTIFGTIPAGCVFTSATDQLDGLELIVSYRQTNGSTTPVPQSGCVTAGPNYESGMGNPSYDETGPNIDCALVRSDSTLPTSWLNNLFPGSPQWLQQILDAENGPNWFGRFSVEGTIYAPSAALEIDDQDSAYPLASRGLIVRHLRVKGFRQRNGASVIPVDLSHNDERKDREVTFVACIRGPGRSASTAACSKAAGDRILTKARVGFAYVPAVPPVGSTPGVAATSTPTVRWWNSAR